MTDTKPQLNYVFDDFADMFVELGAFGTPSELHGLLTGQLAAGVRADAEAWLAMVVAHLDVQAIEDDDDKAELVVLYDMVLEQLTEADFGLQLLLPEDDAELAGRAESLGAWCTGFLSGFGLGFDRSKQKLSSEITDAMEDVRDHILALDHRAVPKRGGGCQRGRMVGGDATTYPDVPRQILPCQTNEDL